MENNKLKHNLVKSFKMKVVFHIPLHSFDWHKVLILIAVKVLKMWFIHWIYVTHFHSPQLYVAENVSDNLLFCYVIFHLGCSFK